LETPVLGAKTGVSEHYKFTENSEFVIFLTFRKLQKNDVKIEFWKLRKTGSYKKTYSNVRFKVWNAGLYQKGTTKPIFNVYMEIFSTRTD